MSKHYLLYYTFVCHTIYFWRRETASCSSLKGDGDDEYAIQYTICFLRGEKEWICIAWNRGREERTVLYHVTSCLAILFSAMYNRFRSCHFITSTVERRCLTVIENRIYKLYFWKGRLESSKGTLLVTRKVLHLVIKKVLHLAIKNFAYLATKKVLHLERGNNTVWDKYRDSIRGIKIEPLYDT